MEYRAQWAYVSARLTLVPGQVIDLDDALAQWLMADSPGVIVPIAEQAMNRAPDAPASDRMHRKGRNVAISNVSVANTPTLIAAGDGMRISLTVQHVDTVDSTTPIWVSNSATIAIGEGFYLSGLGLCCPFYAGGAGKPLVRDRYGQYGYSRCGDRRTLDGVCCHRCGPSNVTGRGRPRASG